MMSNDRRVLAAWYAICLAVGVVIGLLIVAATRHDAPARPAGTPATSSLAPVAAYDMNDEQRDQRRASRSRTVPTPKPTHTHKPVVRKKSSTKRYVGATTDGVWYRLRMCESTNRYWLRDGSVFGAYQFDITTWNGVARRHDPRWVGVNPADAPPSVQDRFAKILQSERGWQPWPACSRKLGLR